MGEMTFTCRVIHSIPMLMSAIQVFYHDKMVTVAHLIGPEQLPCSSEVRHAPVVLQKEIVVTFKNTHMQDECTVSRSARVLR